MKLQPSIEQMLGFAEECGLTTLDESYNNYLLHYTLFFSVINYFSQLAALIDELIKVGLVIESSCGKLTVKDITIKDARKLLT